MSVPDRYEIVLVADAVEEHIPGADDYYVGDDYYAALVVRYGDDGMYIIGADGGEPEDGSFYRGYSWVPDAIQDAYDRGVQHGKESVGT